jgi:hypothetical protein
MSARTIYMVTDPDLIDRVWEESGMGCSESFGSVDEDGFNITLVDDLDGLDFIIKVNELGQKFVVCFEEHTAIDADGYFCPARRFFEETRQVHASEDDDEA